ncbi:hypothetical protein OUZ56_012939 [Daphnia magna]|uniref:Uncharacterized protein n=1 Tax=Daphnia magna TaxID=35525 RepID=A0ABQ9Z4G8_9CRUS|nr:hypothetical protein OUZ56_012939 [Daphnia magna]
MDISTIDEDKPHLVYEGRIMIEERDTFGSPIWVDRTDLNCYAQGARGTPRGSLTGRSYNILRTELTCKHMRESQEQVLHDQREASARAKRANRSARRMELLENRLGYAGDDAQAPEPAAGLNEGVPSLENVAAVQLDKGMAENLD